MSRLASDGGADALAELIDEDAAWEARAIARDLTRAVLSRDTDTNSRWQQNFGGPSETAAAATWHMSARSTP